MKKAVYIHGLGGSGTGGSSRNIREVLKDEYELYGSTYDLLQPKEAFEKIQEDVKGADLVIASSLGGFCASGLNLTELGVGKLILLNPCLKPQEAIEPILFDDQKAMFNKDKCLSEWAEIQSKWNPENTIEHNKIAGIFSDKDELFHYQSVFDENFKSAFGGNSTVINGTHEIAKDMRQLTDAVNGAKLIFETAKRNLQSYIKNDLPKMYGN